MNTEAATIHAAELLFCGCRANPKTGETYSLCARHTNNPASAKLHKNPDGSRPLCPQCSSFRIRPITESASIACDDCGHTFTAADINGFALSIDSKPRVCPSCYTTNYGACSCFATQREAL